MQNRLLKLFLQNTTQHWFMNFKISYRCLINFFHEFVIKFLKDTSRCSFLENLRHKSNLRNSRFIEHLSVADRKTTFSYSFLYIINFFLNSTVSSLYRLKTKAQRLKGNVSYLVSITLTY